MNLKTFAEENGITLKEAKELTGLTHWSKPVPEEFLAKQEVVAVTEVSNNEVQVAEELSEVTVVVEEEACPVSLEVLAVSLRGAGDKSPYYKWKYLIHA